MIKEGFTPEQLKYELASYQPLCKCTMCGRFIQKPDKMFYSSKNFPTFRGNVGVPNICRHCADTYFEELKIEHGEKIALYIILTLLGLYFDPQIYEKLASRGKDVRIG